MHPLSTLSAIGRVGVQTDERFRFVAGQWVDFWAPGVDQVGGYSIASPPSLLENSGQFQLVVSSLSQTLGVGESILSVSGVRVRVATLCWKPNP